MPRMPAPASFPEFPAFPARSPHDVWGDQFAAAAAAWRKAVEQACVDAGMSRNVARKVAARAEG